MDKPLQFYITNNMFDETQLYIAAPGGHRAKRRKTIAHGCQITYKQPGDEEVTDMDIIRPPALVMSCNASTLAGVVGNPTDPLRDCTRRVLTLSTLLRLRHCHGLREQQHEAVEVACGPGERPEQVCL